MYTGANYLYWESFTEDEEFYFQQGEALIVMQEHILMRIFQTYGLGEEVS